MDATQLRARWPWPRVGLLAVIALAMWGLKRHYAMAEVGDLSWILKPVANLSALVSGARFEWEPGSGYLARERLFVIAKPCAGVNFMLAALAMVGFLLSKRAVAWSASAGLLALCLGLAYAATVIANTARIAVALWLTTHPLTTDFWTAARVHRVEGIGVYFGMLVLLHVLLQRLARPSEKPCGAMRETLQRARVPLASYYLVTVLVPLANGSGTVSHAFLEHMAFVVLAPPTLVGCIAVCRLAWHRTAKGRVPVPLSVQRSP
jgi:exosortase K